MKTKTRVQLVLMHKAVDSLFRAKSDMTDARELLFASRINALISELEHELDKWEVIAARVP